jgi:hypothetical protein
MLLTTSLIALAIPAAALADVKVQLQMGFPAVLPPLVEVGPGVSVVQDFDEEVFFTGGYYWVQRDGAWYRARDHRGTWRYVRQDRLPPALARQEPGRYRHWQHDERRTWPAAQQAKGHARHWTAADHQERPRPQDEHQKRDDRHEGDRRGNSR